MSARTVGARGRLLAIAGALLATGWLPGNRLAETVRRGNDALASGDTEAALREYTEAQVLAPEDPRLAYDIGVVLAKSGKADEALKAYAGIPEAESRPGGSPELTARALYNAGGLHYAAQRYREAVEAYKEVLRRTPSDRDAKRNLELALRRLQQQQGQQKESPNPQPNQSGPEEKPQPDPKPQDRPDPDAGDSGRQGPEGAPPEEPEPRPGQEGPGPDPGARQRGREELERLLQSVEEAEKRALRDEHREAAAARSTSGRDW